MIKHEALLRNCAQQLMLQSNKMVGDGQADEYRNSSPWHHNHPPEKLQDRSDAELTSTAMPVLSSTGANQFIENKNKDLEFENEKIMLMDNISQAYTEEEDAAIESALGLVSGMEMAGVTLFKNFPTTLNTTRYLRGFYLYKEGDIYAKSAFMI
ncbi:hypothetical protein TrLO_g2817 [Triparma laevis f. longispina]|uniref:Uncharacterized protein n=1 Tax=Triparma laevis f. longispina TaxID=1714387 RepID=A0A9W7KZL2_9STRA|nr:hypothetical protein TrLO_g2817 [Triparma laevis f. longispina]